MFKFDLFHNGVYSCNWCYSHSLCGVTNAINTITPENAFNAGVQGIFMIVLCEVHYEMIQIELFRPRCVWISFLVLKVYSTLIGQLKNTNSVTADTDP